MHDNDLSPRLSDAKLFSKIEEMQTKNDSLSNPGGRMLATLLRVNGHAVSEARVRNIQKDLNPDQAEERRHATTSNRYTDQCLLLAS